jgi:hypothetical protein
MEGGTESVRGVRHQTQAIATSQGLPNRSDNQTADMPLVWPPALGHAAMNRFTLGEYLVIVDLSSR